jgi:enamine deaminase RidA (YjgF/YER057c/UK114 family)
MSRLGDPQGGHDVRRVIVPQPFAHFPRDWHLSPALDTGEWVFLSGVTATRPDGSVEADPETQFRDAFGHATACLREAGLGWEDVVEMTTYHVGLRRHLDAFIQAKDEVVHEPYPAWSAIGVSELITPGTLVEIRIIARRSGGSASHDGGAA